FRRGACAVSATDPRWNGTWVLPPLLLIGSQPCVCQHLSRMETRLGVEPSQTWFAATCLAVRPTRHGSEGRARTCATWLTARHDCRYITSDCVPSPGIEPGLLG